MTTKDVLALALEALEKLWLLGDQAGAIAGPAITAIKQAITPETGNAATPGASAITAGNDEADMMTVAYLDGVDAGKRMAQQAQEPVAVASIFVTFSGEREIDDWRHPLPVGRNLLYAHPAPKQAEPCQHCGATHAKGMNTLCDDGKPQAEPTGKQSLQVQWQPIESAPKDGREILLANPDGSCAVGWFKFRGHTTGWTDGDTFNMTWPTHWMELPTPPEAT
jgi:hypothetical protein